VLREAEKMTEKKTANLSALIEPFKVLARALKEARTLGRCTPRPGEAFTIFRNIVVIGEPAAQLHDIENALFEAVRTDGHVSRSASTSILRDSLSALLSEEFESDAAFECALKKEWKVLCTSLTEPPSKWEHYFRVVGFDYAELPFTFGNVTFRLATTEFVSLLQNRLAEAIARTANTGEEKRSFTELIGEDVSKHFENNVLAVLSTLAIDSDAANSLAVQEVRKTLDVLNFFGDWRYPPSSVLALPWDGHGANEQFLSFKVGAAGCVVFHDGWKGGWIPVSTHRLTELLGLREASMLLGEAKPNGFQKRLLSALQWAGRGASKERPDEQLLFMVIALENLLLGSKSEVELGYRFRVRGAHLIGKDFAEKLKVQQCLRDLYTLRSKLVHSGTAPIKESDLALLRYYAKKAILTVLTHSEFAGMTRDDQLETWFDQKVLG
jgi:hypothetical protein